MLFRRRLPNLSARPGRVLVAVIALLSFLAGTVGFPLPVANGPHAAKTPSACRGCGCSESGQLQGSCCCSKRAATPACCAGKTAPPAASEDEPQEQTSTFQWVVGLKAAECRGVGSVWLTLQGTAPPPSAVTWTFEDAPAGWLASSPELPFVVTVLPTVPPPRG
jgi:hypothetical protein